MTSTTKSFDAFRDDKVRDTFRNMIAKGNEIAKQYFYDFIHDEQASRDVELDLDREALFYAISDGEEPWMIIDINDDGQYHLTLERSEFQGGDADLPAIEWELYKWGFTEREAPEDLPPRPTFL